MLEYISQFNGSRFLIKLRSSSILILIKNSLNKLVKAVFYLTTQLND
jgi:hypothetical protein